MNSNVKFKIFILVFFSVFVVVGLSLVTFSLVKLAKFNFAEQVEATVISAEYLPGEMNVTFGYINNGEYVEAVAHFDNIKFENGELPYYEGKQVIIRISNSNEVLQFGKIEIIVIIGGVLFAVVGASFIYFLFGNKKKLADISCDYKNAIVEYVDGVDNVVEYEAEAEKLTELPSNSFKRICGEIRIWKIRIKDRFKVFTIWENILCCTLLVVPIIILSIEPLFFGKQISIGYVICNIIIWLFIYSFVGMIFKICNFAYYKLLVKLGKFNKKEIAKVLCSAFESSAYFQVGTISRTYTTNKKFRVVALIDGKRSVGYVKGVVPPSKGSILKVLIRPRHYKRWIIDNN